MKFYSKKQIQLKNAQIHLHYANNKGRGKNNVTVTVMPLNSERLDRARYTEYLEQYRTSGWRGVVNIPSRVLEAYGGLDQ